MQTEEQTRSEISIRGLIDEMFVIRLMSVWRMWSWKQCRRITWILLLRFWVTSADWVYEMTAQQSSPKSCWSPIFRCSIFLYLPVSSLFYLFISYLLFSFNLISYFPSLSRLILSHTKFLSHLVPSLLISFNFIPSLLILFYAFSSHLMLYLFLSSNLTTSLPILHILFSSHFILHLLFCSLFISYLLI